MFDNEVDLLIAAARVLASHHPVTKNSVQNEGQNLLARAWYAETVRRWDEFAKTNQELGADKEEALALMEREYGMFPALPETVCVATIGAPAMVAKVGEEHVNVVDIMGAVPLWVHYVHLIRALRCRPKI